MLEAPAEQRQLPVLLNQRFAGAEWEPEFMLFTCGLGVLQEFQRVWGVLATPGDKGYANVCYGARYFSKWLIDYSE